MQAAGPEGALEQGTLGSHYGSEAGRGPDTDEFCRCHGHVASEKPNLVARGGGPGDCWVKGDRRCRCPIRG